MKKFRDLPTGAQFTQRVAGVRLSAPLVYTKVAEYPRGPYGSVNAHAQGTHGLVRAYIYADEDVEEITP